MSSPSKQDPMVKCVFARTSTLDVYVTGIHECESKLHAPRSHSKVYSAAQKRKTHLLASKGKLDALSSDVCKTHAYKDNPVKKTNRLPRANEVVHNREDSAHIGLSKNNHVHVDIKPDVVEKRKEQFEQIRQTRANR